MEGREKGTNGSLNASGMGVGKTLIAVELCKRLDKRCILIIAPLGTRLGWMATFHRQGFGAPFRWIRTSNSREELLDLHRGTPGVYFVGTELFAYLGWRRIPVLDDEENPVLVRASKPVPARFSDKSFVKDIFDKPVLAEHWKVVHKTVPLTTWKKAKPDIILFDEAHRGQNRRSLTYKTLSQLPPVDKAYRHAMSGTPTGNSFTGAWAVTRWTFPKHTDRSYWRWVDEWCAVEDDYFSPSGKKVVGEKVPGAYLNSLPCYIRLESDMGRPNEETVYVDLTPKQRTIYNKLEKDFFVMLGNDPLLVEIPLALDVRLSQVTLAEPYIDEFGVVNFKDNARSSKIDAMMQWIEEELEAEEKALIGVNSSKFNGIAVSRFASKGYNVERWDGTVSQPDREAAKERFIEGDSRFLFAVHSAVAEGVDGLQRATSNVLWFNKDGRHIINSQFLARVLRSGQTKPVRSVTFEAIDTRDTGKFSRLVQAELDNRRSIRYGR